MTPFEKAWAFIQTNLKAGTTINNWTALHGYLGDKMTIAAVRANNIEVDAPKANSIQVVPKSDFEIVWKVWPEYKALKCKRYELRDMTRFSKYIISIFYWYEKEEQNGCV